VTRVRLVFMYVLQAILIRRRNAVLRKHLRDDMKVIGDFGCGHFPNRYATVLVDRFSSADEQRGGLSLTKRAGQRDSYDVDLNVFPYPFAEDSFDFLICSHVLEYLDDPVRTCEEFSRIAKVGYIEVPRSDVDILIRNNDTIHKWLCSYGSASRTLTFFDRRRSIEARRPGTVNIFRRFFLQLRSLCVVWSGDIRAEYAGRPWGAGRRIASGAVCRT